MAQFIFLRSPQGDEIKEVEATLEKLTPYMAQGWHQVPAPEGHPVIVVQEEK
jgi:hypothetical protein